MGVVCCFGGWAQDTPYDLEYGEISSWVSSCVACRSPVSRLGQIASMCTFTLTHCLVPIMYLQSSACSSQTFKAQCLRMSATATFAALFAGLGIGLWHSELLSSAPEQSFRPAAEEATDRVERDDEGFEPSSGPQEPSCPRCSCPEPSLPAHREWLRRVAVSPGYGPEAALGGTVVGWVLCRLATLAAQRRVTRRPRHQYGAKRVSADRARPAVLG